MLFRKISLYIDLHVTFWSQKLKFEEFHNKLWKCLIALCFRKEFFKGYWINKNNSVQLLVSQCGQSWVEKWNIINKLKLYFTPNVRQMHLFWRVEERYFICVNYECVSQSHLQNVLFLLESKIVPLIPQILWVCILFYGVCVLSLSLYFTKYNNA